MGKKRRETSRFYTAPDAATDDLYEALCYHYWNNGGYARELLMAVSDKYEAGGYNLKETTSSSSKQEETGGPEDMAACDLDDLDYDSVANQGDQHPWDGWIYRHDATDFH